MTEFLKKMKEQYPLAFALFVSYKTELDEMRARVVSFFKDNGVQPDDSSDTELEECFKTLEVRLSM